MTHTALLIHSLAQRTHDQERTDREARHRQSEPTSEREREQHTTQHNDEYIVNTLTMQYSSMVWYGVGQGRLCVVGRAGQADSPTAREQSALATGRVHREQRNNLTQLFYFSFGFNAVNGPSHPRISPHTIAKQYSGADAGQRASRNAQSSRRASKIVKNLTM